MDTTELARAYAERIIAHRNKLAGKAPDAAAAQFALHQASQVLTEQRDQHKKAATTALAEWDGSASEKFEKRTGRLGRQIRETDESARAAEQVVATVTASIDTGHATAQRIVDDYVQKASKAIEAGVGTNAAGSPAGLMRAAAIASDIEKQYAKESVQNLRRVNGELKDAAEKLRRLERQIEHDGVVDPKDRSRRSAGGKRPRDARKPRGGGDRPSGTRPAGSGRGTEIVSAARKEIGTRESPPGSNRNPYGPTAAWCSSFATSMWRKAGVKIPVLPFTGDVYKWGQNNGHSYPEGDIKREVRPGDVLLFGTGPSSPSTSTHIGVVEKVDGDTVTLIEGNSGDSVRRNTHSLSSGKFYGGVHP